MSNTVAMTTLAATLMPFACSSMISSMTQLMKAEEREWWGGLSIKETANSDYWVLYGSLVMLNRGADYNGN